jgi:hypothetical protein
MGLYVLSCDMTTTGANTPGQGRSIGSGRTFERCAFSRDRTYVLKGRLLRMQGTPSELSSSPEFVESFLGGRGTRQPARN